MTKREALRQTHQENTLMSLGFTRDEAEALRRISMRLRAWHERECGTDGGCIERDETTNKPYWLNRVSGRRFPIRDMETGARKRLAAIVNDRNTRVWQHAGGSVATIALRPYVQTDPRGCALYILRPGDVPEGGDPSAYYSRGIAVY